MQADRGTGLLEAVRARLARDPRPFVVGVSGGVDSMVLLHLCAGRSSPTSAVHVHHGLRAAADHDAALVSETCSRLGVPVRVVAVSGDALRNSPFSIESAARTARYNILAEQARPLGACILTAHHANDRLETLWMRLGQGTGLSGLAGPDAETLWDGVPVWRPLLDLWKSEILAWADEHRVVWSHDEMNDDPGYERVRIRHEVVPVVMDRLPLEPLRRSLRQVADDAGLLRWLVERERQQLTLHRSEDRIVLERRRLCELPEGLCRAVVHQSLLHVLNRGDRRARPESRWVVEVVQLMRRPGPSVVLGRRVRCEISRERVTIGYTKDPRAALVDHENSGDEMKPDPH
jgi:tRNA(Ile)-lysidine synthase